MALDIGHRQVIQVPDLPDLQDRTQIRVTKALHEVSTSFEFLSGAGVGTIQIHEFQTRRYARAWGRQRDKPEYDPRMQEGVSVRTDRRI